MSKLKITMSGIKVSNMRADDVLSDKAEEYSNAMNSYYDSIFLDMLLTPITISRKNYIEKMTLRELFKRKILYYFTEIKNRLYYANQALMGNYE